MIYGIFFYNNKLFFEKKSRDTVLACCFMYSLNTYKNSTMRYGIFIYLYIFFIFFLFLNSRLHDALQRLGA